ncbi:hypothetical protein Bca4012_083046 [Brassica carinata]
MKSRLKISKAEDESEINAPGVEKNANIAHIRKMADVTRVLVAVSFSHKTHWNLNEQSRRMFYKNWGKSKKKAFTGYAKQYENEEGKKNVQTQIKKMKGLKQKKAHMMEIKTNGGTINQKVNFAYNFFEKLIPIGVIGVTKGKGYEGVVTRWDVNPMGGFAHHGVVKDDCLRIKFKQMRSLIGVQEIDLPNSSRN